MILITGGAGYIGSHCALNFQRAGYECAILDNLSEGHVEALCGGEFFNADLLNINEIREVFGRKKLSAVIHFAGSCYVGESMSDPQKYYYNNVVSTMNLLKVMMENDVKNIVFSSTCATYGYPKYLPIDENHPQKPVSTYGNTKLIIEEILKDYNRSYGLNYMILRYFNASGADHEANIGESHSPETHLIPLVLKAAKGELEEIKIFGTDYDTPDGTCIRDYIHVNDLSKAHRLAVEKLFATGISDIFNLGIGKGFSVDEIIDVCDRVTGKKVKRTYVQRREGDATEMVACSKKAQKLLDWQPDFDDIEEIVKTAWLWENNRKY
jgi:UDP-glucose 4-epimerase